MKSTLRTILVFILTQLIAASARAENPWDILGVPTSCSTAEARAAWKKASLRAHPDMPGGSLELQKQLNQALDSITKNKSIPSQALRLGGPVPIIRLPRVPGLGGPEMLLDALTAHDPWNHPVQNLSDLFERPRASACSDRDTQLRATKGFPPPWLRSPVESGLTVVGAGTDLFWSAVTEIPFEGLDNYMIERNDNYFALQKGILYNELNAAIMMQQPDIIVSGALRRFRDHNRMTVERMVYANDQRWASSDLYRGVYGARGYTQGPLKGTPKVYERRCDGTPGKPYDPTDPSHGGAFVELPDNAIFARMFVGLSRLIRPVDYRQDPATGRWFYKANPVRLDLPPISLGIPMPLP